MKLDLAVRNESERKRYHRSDNLRRIGEAVLQAELGAQQFVHRAHDVGNARHRAN